MQVRLIQPRELFGPPERQEELKRCWSLNDGLFDSYALPEGRPTFSELFELCEADTINVVANSDLYYGPEFVKLLKKNPPTPKMCYALSRWDVDTTGSATLWNNHDSQDSFIFQGKPLIDAPFTQGRGGCDNRLVWLLEEAGYTVLNPSKTLKSYHLHLVDYRSYITGEKGPGRGGQKVDRIPGPYGFAKPCEL